MLLFYVQLLIITFISFGNHVDMQQCMHARSHVIGMQLYA
jgi:hypothetical protein